MGDPIRGLRSRFIDALTDGAVLDLERELVPAGLIRTALLGRPYEGAVLIPVDGIDPRGLQLVNARIVGVLDLRNVRTAIRIELSACVLGDGLNVSHARLDGGLSLPGSVISYVRAEWAVIRGVDFSGVECSSDYTGTSLSGDGLQVDGDMLLRGGFTSAGAVRLSGAHITGSLDLSGAQLTGTDNGGISLHGDGLQVDGAMLLRGGFTSAGAIRLPGAHITGSLEMNGAQLTGTDTGAVRLYGDGLQVDGRMFLGDGFTSAGAIRLIGAHITGQLDLSGAQLTGADTGGVSLHGDGLQVDGSMFLPDGFTSTGAVGLPGAHITGSLDLSGAQLTGTDRGGVSLHGEGLQVDGRMFLGDGFTSAGGVRLIEAHITRSLDMSGAQLTGADTGGISLYGDGLQVDGDMLLPGGFSSVGAIRLSGAHITGSLDLSGAHLTGANTEGDGLHGDGLQVDGGMFLGDGFTSAGAIRLSGAHITGRLDLSGAQLTGTDNGGISLPGDGLQVDGDMLLRGGFTSVGAIRLPGAHITGSLDLSGAQLTGANTEGVSLEGDRLQVGRSMFLRGEFSSAGAVRLPGAHITGSLDLSGARLTGANTEGDGLHGDGLQVDGGMFLGDGFTSAGAVRLIEAHITGQLDLSGARLTGADTGGVSLHARGLQLDGSMFLLRGGFTGVIRLIGAHITGSLEMDGAQLTGKDTEGRSLYGDGLQVDGSMMLTKGFISTGAVDLTGGRINHLLIDLGGLRTRGADHVGLSLERCKISEFKLLVVDNELFTGRRLRRNDRQHPPLPEQRLIVSLENCRYSNRPEDNTKGDTQVLQEWLRLLRFHVPAYQPRAYQQLAAAHRATGHDRDASRILIAQQDHRRAVALRPEPGTASLPHRISLWASRAGLGIWKAVLGYGYRPRRALLWLIALLAVAGGVVTFAAHWPADPAVSDVPVAHRPADANSSGLVEYCSIGEAAGLAVRIAVPLVTNLGQGTCIIDTASPAGSWLVFISIVLQTFAWILGALTLAAAATAIRRNT